MTSVFPSWWTSQENQQLWLWEGKGGLTLARLWLALAGISGWLVQPIRWPKVMRAESAGLGSGPKAPLPTPNCRPPVPPRSLLVPPSVLNPHPTLFPKILTKHFCTIKFNHNYKNVASGLRY